MAFKVIDVSSWQETIDFKKVKADGIAGVILRVGLTGYGTSKTKRADSCFEQFYKDAKAAGLGVGGYWYSCAYTEAEAKQEAAKILELIKGKTFEYPLFWDTEDAHNINESGCARQNQYIIGKTQLTKCALAFCKAMEAAGYYTGIYASKSWFDNCLDMSKLTTYDKWVAHYTTAAHPEYEQQFGMWQYSSSGRVNGIGGKVDMNHCYKDYPAIIKKAGLNGFKKIDNIDELKKENSRLKSLLTQINTLSKI